MNSIVKKTVLFLALVPFVLLLGPQVGVSSGARNKTTKSSKQGTGTAMPMMPMPLVAPLFIANGEFASSLVLVNASGLTTYADVSIRAENGTELATAQVTFSPYSQQQVDLGTLLLSKGIGNATGSIVVMPSADLKGPAVLAALSLTYLNSREGDFIDEELAMPGPNDSQVLRGVADVGENSPLVAITSLATSRQHVTIQCLNSNGPVFAKNVTLAAGATILTEACTGRPWNGTDPGSAWEDDKDRDREQGAVGIALTSNGMPGSFAAFGLSPHQRRGGRYFSSVTFADPQMTMSPNTVFTGSPVGQVLLLGGRTYVPEISVANFSAKAAHVTVQYALTSGATATAQNVWTGVIPAQHTSKVTLHNLEGDSGLQDSFVVASDASPGDLMAKFTAQTDSGMQEAEVLGKDEMVMENGGGHPWSLEDGTDSTLLLFNHSSETQSVRVSLSNNSGSKPWFKTYPLKSMETMQLSIIDLIKNKVPDNSGAALPATSTSGIAGWFTEKNGVVKGRILQSNAMTGMARNFSCGDYADVAGAVWSPSGTTDLIVGTTGDNGGEALAILDLVYPGSCSGSYATTTTAYDYYYTSSSPSTAAIAYPTDSYADVNADSGGYATITGTITDPSTGCSASAEGSVQVAPPASISSVSPGSFVIGAGGLLTIMGSGLSGKGTPTIQFSTGGISTSSVTVVSDSKVTATYSVSCSAQAQNISLTFPSFDNATTNLLPITTALPPAPAPSISFGGGNVTNTTQSVVVGQQIALTGSNPSLPACMSFVSGSWSTLPTGSTGVGGYTNAAGTGLPDTTGGKVQPLPANNATSYTFYWVGVGNSLQMSYAYEMSGGGGYVDSTPATVTFNVSGPTSVIVDPLTGTVVVPPSANRLESAVLPDVGVALNGSGTPPSGDSGTFLYVQIITTWNIVYYYNGGNCSFSQGTGLDDVFPFSEGLSTNDTPGIPLFSNDTEATAAFVATMYFMWQPSVSPSIQIPLGYVNWQWSGDAVQNSGAWSLKSGSSSAGSFVSSSTYPQWTTYVVDNQAPPCH